MSEKKAIYFEGKIYEEVTLQLLFDKRNDKHFEFTSYPVSGSHNWTDGQEVTGMYELKKQVYPKFQQKWVDYTGDERLFNVTQDKFKRTIAIPTTPVQKKYNEGDRVWCLDIDGEKKHGNIYLNSDQPNVSEWYIRYDDGEECAVLDISQVYTTTPTSADVVKEGKSIDWHLGNIARVKEIAELKNNLNEYREECERLAGLVRFWQDKYYEAVPDLIPGKIDNNPIA